ncbi:hypothetical protein TIFTF001_010144 [Ficus carica]|uniref:IREH1/IRE-like N-terminal domain-containing protein n=1 Tax=Ficus carica TaxID=3494 RepID=A0AA87ZWI0_FICCA|nr:hypothetical protein TIFTF001_010144 [Ficus carica]
MSDSPAPHPHQPLHQPSPVAGDITATTSSSSPTQSSPSSRPKLLLKIPPIPVRGIARGEAEESEEEEEEDDGDEDEDDEDGDGDGDGDDRETEDKESNVSSFVTASAFGLNYIRTRSIPSPLRFSSSADVSSSNLGNDSTKAKCAIEQNSSKLVLAEQGRKVRWSHSKSLKNPSPRNPGLEGNYAVFAKEIQSPRFQAVLRVTSGRKKRAPDIKSFSHELDSKGVRPFPVWRPRALGHMEEIMVAIRAKFDKLKEEVNSDLGAYAGDLVAILASPELPPGMKESLEDLLVVARLCATMSPDEFWVKCEGIVQNLDDRRQELPVGILKQAHTRILFILTRCTRLVQFQKESGYEEDRILGLHQLSDLGVYPEQLLEAIQRDVSGPLSEKDVSEKHGKKSHGKEKGGGAGGNTKRFDTSFGAYRMSSWRKLPSPAKKNRKEAYAVDTVFEDKSEDSLHAKDEIKTGGDYNVDSPDASSCHPDHTQEPAGVRRLLWGPCGDHQHHVTDEHLMICRICEVEIPTAHVEEHSRICTIADRCDLKGLTVNERLERVEETLEKIIESFTPKSTPKSTDTPAETFDAARVSTSSAHEEAEVMSPKKSNLSRRCSVDMLDCAPDASSGGSLTPRSPLLTPRTSQIELLLNGRKTISELENQQQVCCCNDPTFRTVN